MNTDVLLINIEEAARRLSIDRGTYYRKYNQGVIGPQFVRLGGSCRVNARELEAWTEAGCPCRTDWQARGAAV